MKNMKRKLSSLVLATVFASTQFVYAVMDTGLGIGNGGATINNTTGGFVNMTTGTGNATLNFNGSSHVNWNTLNVNKGETLNFNTVNGATGVTVLNTVNTNMSQIYGQVNADGGISKLIISNPNGVLFDGAKFTATGDVMVTTQPMTATFVDGKMNVADIAAGTPVEVVQIKDSDINIGGEFNILSPTVNVAGGNIATGKGFKLVTENGQDFLGGITDLTNVVKLEAVNIDGDVFIVSDKGIVNTISGGKISGDLNVDAKNGSVTLNYADNGKALEVGGNVNAKANGVMTYARNIKVAGNLNLENGGGFLEVGNVQVDKDMNLKTTAKSENAYGYKHFTHVIGKNDIKGNVKIESKDNIHIGNYNITEGKLLDGNLNVGGDLSAHAQDGHVMVTIDTKADKIDLKSDNLNVLSDNKATLTAKEYKFSSNGYIGGLNGVNGATTDDVVIAVMENYHYIPNTVNNAGNINITGGEIKQIKTPSVANILSKGDVKLTGADAKYVNITAPQKYIEITGNNVKADTIYVGKETDKLKVDFPSRNYTVKYTNIRDGVETTITGDEEITYELTNGENGYNTKDIRPVDTTYLVGPEKPIEPQPTPNPDDNENAKILRSFERPEAVDKVQPYTPVAYAADLEDDAIDTGVRKNVDGSVTVVRAYPMQ